MSEVTVPRRMIINLQGWWLPGVGGLNKGRVIDLEELDEAPRKRITEAYLKKETGFCRNENSFVRVVLKKMDESDIRSEVVDEMAKRFAEVTGATTTMEEIEEFKRKLLAPKKKPVEEVAKKKLKSEGGKKENA